MKMIQKAPGFDADAIILDLEDSVPLEEKESARLIVKEALENLDFGDIEVMVRINPLEIYGLEDLTAILPSGPHTIVLPKCEGPGDVQKVETVIKQSDLSDPVGIMPLIETAKGVHFAYQIATASQSVEALMFGAEDYTRDIGAERTREGSELDMARGLLVIAAKAAGVQVLDTVYSDFRDNEGLRIETKKIKAMGFDGKGAIHPVQLSVINEIFTPTREEILHAVNVIRASDMAKEKGCGVAVLGGKMIDRPVLERAIKVLEIARRTDIDIPEPQD